jgi:hypothetical protein
VRNAFLVFGTLCLAAALVFVIAVWRGDSTFGIASLWQRLAGPADLGPVDFAAIIRSPTGNDALICPPDLCGATRTDGVAPVFLVPAARLRDAVRAIEADDPDVFALASGGAPEQDRYLARTRLMRFPDTVNVRFIELGGGRSTLALYSRSQIGRSDFGANKARLAGWIRLLRAALPVANP